MRIKDWAIGREFEVEIKINPLPPNCMECPFYQHYGEGEYGEDIFDCILCPIEDNFGIAVHRYKDCPFNKGKEN